ncbi:MAG: purine-nucleoside phosphorylase [Planctomycetota bacterium]
MTYVFEEALEAAASVKNVAGKPEVGVILGSGLGNFAERLQQPEAVPYARIPNFPPARVGGHAGQLLFASLGDVRIAVLSGRIHYYEGYSLDKVTLGVRTLALLGIKALIVTNASGGIREDLLPGKLMIIGDHINLMGTNPLIGPRDPRLGHRFVDLTEVYDRGIRKALARAGKSARVPLLEGVYAALSGPSYETPAEIRMLSLLGADAVGMSTVPEVIAARQMGVKVAGLSCIANRAAGLAEGNLSHKDVMEVTERASGSFCRLLNKAIPLVAEAVRPKAARRRRRPPSIQEQRSVGIRFKGGRKRR